LAEADRQRDSARRQAEARPRRARLAPIDFDATRAAVEKKTGHKPGETELMSYVMYPTSS